MSQPSRRLRWGFTLVELLVVIGIIAVLIAILLPAVRKAMEQANAIKCQANLRSMMQACLTFAADYKGHLPGLDSDYGQKEFWKRCVYSGPPIGTPPPANNAEKVATAPHNGTLWKYLRNRQIYLCPSSQSSGQYGAGGGTNESFDYVFFKSFAGAKLNKIKTISWHNPVSVATDFNRLIAGARQAPTPYITQEHPGTTNFDNMEPGHSNVDGMTNIHSGGAYYASIDGSVHWFKEHEWGRNHGIRTDFNALHLARRWVSKDPLSPGVKNLGRIGTRFGEWNDIPAVNW